MFSHWSLQLQVFNQATEKAAKSFSIDAHLDYCLAWKSKLAATIQSLQVIWVQLCLDRSRTPFVHQASSRACTCFKVFVIPVPCDIMFTVKVALVSA